MSKLVLDGSWTPFYFIDWPLLIYLEVVTFIMEFCILYIWNRYYPKEKQWTTAEVFAVTFLMNCFSFAICLIVIIFF